MSARKHKRNIAFTPDPSFGFEKQLSILPAENTPSRIFAMAFQALPVGCNCIASKKLTPAMIEFLKVVDHNETVTADQICTYCPDEESDNCFYYIAPQNKNFN